MVLSKEEKRAEKRTSKNVQELLRQYYVGLSKDEKRAYRMLELLRQYWSMHAFMDPNQVKAAWKDFWCKETGPEDEPFEVFLKNLRNNRHRAWAGLIKECLGSRILTPRVMRPSLFYSSSPFHGKNVASLTTNLFGDTKIAGDRDGFMKALVAKRRLEIHVFDRTHVIFWKP
jgi:hypothetical protein